MRVALAQINTTVGDIVGEPLLVHKMGDRSQRKAKVRELLETVGINPNTLNRYPHEFSGGQRQRVAIARALANDPPLLMGDEPTGNLDSKTGKEIMLLIGELHRTRGITVIFVTHDPAIAANAQRVIKISDGMVAA